MTVPMRKGTLMQYSVTFIFFPNMIKQSQKKSNLKFNDSTPVISSVFFICVKYSFTCYHWRLKVKHFFHSKLL